MTQVDNKENFNTIIENKALSFRREIAEYTKKAIGKIKHRENVFFQDLFNNKEFIKNIYRVIRKPLNSANEQILIFTFFDHIQNIYHVIPKALVDNEYFSALCSSEKINCLMKNKNTNVCGKKANSGHCLHQENFEQARKIAVEVYWFRELTLTDKLLKNPDQKFKIKPMIIDFLDGNINYTPRPLNEYYSLRIIEKKNIKDNEIESLLSKFENSNEKKVDDIKENILNSQWIKENTICDNSNKLQNSYNEDDWKIFLFWIRIVFLHSRTVVIYPLPVSRPTGLVIYAHKDIISNAEIQNIYDILDILLSDLFINILLEVDEIQENQLIEKSKEYANVSILIDSFAHNIAAHSLSALSTYFAKRKNMLEQRDIAEFGNWKRDIELNGDELIYEHSNKKEKRKLTNELEKVKEYNTKIGYPFYVNSTPTLSILDLIKYFSEYRKKLYSLEQNNQTRQEDKKCLLLPISIDDVIHNYLNYLNEKAEFWSGVIQGESFGGEIVSIYDILWDFVNNPLFLGTIVASENIHKIKFTINSKDFIRIDFSAINDIDNSGNYKFVELLQNFDKIKKRYEKIEEKVFLPGQNVGRQSFYTIIENIIRNIKHYKWEDIDEVTININIFSYNKKYKFVIGLEHKNFRDDNKDAQKIVHYIKKLLDKGTYNYELNQPIMGGNSQNFLCARQLFTNDFNEDSESILNKLYKKNNNQISILNRNGNVNYSFKIWKGEDFGSYKISDKNNIDNYSRYKILITDKLGKNGLLKKDQGVIRIVESNDEEQDYSNLFSKWLKTWLKEKLNNPYYANFNYSYYKICSNNKTIDFCISNSNEYNNQEKKNRIAFFHGEPERPSLTIRNHGIFRKSLQNNLERTKFEIVEALLTGVYIIDNRVYNIYKDKINEEVIEDKVFLYVGKEDELSLHMANLSSIPKKISAETMVKLEDDEKNIFLKHYQDQKDNYELKKEENMSNYDRKKIINILCRINHIEKSDIIFKLSKNGEIIINSNINFLVIHLSFIESIYSQKYKGEKITNFIEKIKEGINRRDNFKLIITTGRGRTDWKKYIREYSKSNLVSIITYRSPYSIKNAMLTGILKGDDFDLKYNLIKVLFGS